MIRSARRPLPLMILLTVLIGGLFGFAHSSFAQEATTPQAPSPYESAGQIRSALFAAQAALLAGDSTTAIQKVNEAEATYQESLAVPFTSVAPDAQAAIEQSIAQAKSAVQSADAPGLAAARGALWAGLLNGSTQATLAAIEKGDGTAANEWLLLREYRKATRFSRPGADATLAVTALVNGKMSAPDALTAVRNDLYDTYQAKLNQALAAADSADSNGFTAKRAEMAGAAAGYFDILAPAFAKQRGAQSLAAGQKVFDSFQQTAAESGAPSYAAGRTQIDSVLKGFRAAPLSTAELQRRAGQLSRYIALVDVEYARGVKDGHVIKDLEIQEALTFRDGAAAAFADLQSTLDGIDYAKSAQVAGLLRDLDTQIRGTVDPKVVEASVNTVLDTLGALFPADWKTVNTGSDFDVITAVLDQIEPAVQQGQYGAAESARLEAYAILDSGIEQKLRGFSPDLAVRVESTFWQGQADKAGLALLIANKASPVEVKAGMIRLRAGLAEAQVAMSAFKTAPGAVVGNSGVIVFREGLEAVLILASLVASMRAPETRKFRRPIFVGAALAFLVTGLTWVVANSLLMSLVKYGEKLEAVVSLISIGVLLLITNWFFHKTYWTGWMANFHTQKSKILGGAVAVGPIVGLIVLGFTSIYREGFETVLFLQSLVLEAGIGVVLQGVAVGLVFVAIIGAITFGLQARLPYKKMLMLTGIMISVVLLTMVGKTVFAMQAVGWMPIAPIPGLYLPYWAGQWFGLYATWQGILLQVTALAFVLGSYFLAEHQNKLKRVKQSSRRPAKPELAATPEQSAHPVKAQ